MIVLLLIPLIMTFFPPGRRNSPAPFQDTQLLTTTSTSPTPILCLSGASPVHSLLHLAATIQKIPGATYCVHP
jgi:hypothetical protein